MQLMGQLAGGSSLPDLADPSSNVDEPMNEFDIEAQRKIAEHIRLQNIQQNMEHALEYMPEAFGNVVMLYINCIVNGHEVKAFVDSGNFLSAIFFNT
jgi:ABC-type multidrug transport system ATPase subunit